MNTIASVYYGFDMMAMFSHKSQVIRPRTFERPPLFLVQPEGGLKFKKGLF
jgi:hypothetical protein